MSNDAKSVLAVAASQVGIRTGEKYWNYLLKCGFNLGKYVSGSVTPWCAGFVSWVFHDAGAKCPGLPAASCTYGIYPKALAAKAVVPVSKAKPGDVILFNFDRNPDDAEHVGIIKEVHDGYFVTYEGNTNAQGSSTGGQVAIKYRPKSNTFAIIRPQYDEPVKPKQPDSKRINNRGLAYRSHVQNLGWLDVVHDGQISGTVGYGLRMEAFKCMPPAGVRLTFNWHMQGIGWRSYENVERGVYDPVMGTTGEKRRLEAVQIHAEGLKESERLRYRAHVQGMGWLPWVEAGKTAGTTGKSLRLEALQIEIVT